MSSAVITFHPGERTLIDYDRPESHRDELAREFGEVFKAKYDKGQVEHGGRLWRKNCSALLLEEVLDFWAYAKTMDKQRQAAIAMLRDVVQDGYLKCDDLRGVRGAIALLEGLENDSEHRNADHHTEHTGPAQADLPRERQA